MNENSLGGILGHTGVRVALISVFTVLALFLFVQTVTSVQGFGRSGSPATDTITVQGAGQATLPPDVARISFTVQNTASTVSEAQSRTTKQANAAIEYVKGKGVAEKDVKTLSYNISPQYSYPNPCPRGSMCPDYIGSPKITGYQVSQTVQVTMRDLTAVGAMLSGLGSLEVQNINGPDFALDDSTAGYDKAREDAINKAKTQADILAKQLGVRLGKIVNFSESSGGYMPYPMGFGGAAEAKVSSAPNIPVGENTYNASVSITYEIR
ncbi:MAG: SIMPL domain-containing protein [bacterium]|nr:SIMPL domain-containing protein [bacterium]MDO8742324.1 SIMPL domain-containing protein [bacterium]